MSLLKNLVFLLPLVIFPDLGSAKMSQETQRAVEYLLNHTGTSCEIPNILSPYSHSKTEFQVKCSNGFAGEATRSFKAEENSLAASIARGHASRFDPPTRLFLTAGTIDGAFAILSSTRTTAEVKYTSDGYAYLPMEGNEQP